MKPVPITVFALCYMGQALMSATHNFLNPAALQLRIETTLGLRDGSGEFGLLLILAVRIAFAGWLAWLVYARANRFGKWAVVVLFTGRIWQGLSQWAGLVHGLVHGNPNSIVWATETGLYLIAGACLFLPQARYWFESKGRSPRAEAKTFE